jgi:N-methylhydantoinase A
LSGSWPVIVPPGPGVLCAYGDATTRVQDEASQTFVARIDELTADTLIAELEKLRARASESFEADGIAADQQEVNYQADIRYSGQAFQLSLGVTIDALKSTALAVLTDEFDRQHEQLFTFAHGKDHEIVMLRAIVKAKSSLVAELKEVSDKKTKLADAKLHDTKFYHEKEWHEAVIYDRDKLGVGTVVTGPAIVVEMDATTLILPGHAAIVDKVGNLLINPA